MKRTSTVYGGTYQFLSAKQIANGTAIPSGKFFGHFRTPPAPAGSVRDHVPW